MSIDQVQYQKGYSMFDFFENYGTEEQCETALFRGDGLKASFAYHVIILINVIFKIVIYSNVISAIIKHLSRVTQQGFVTTRKYHAKLTQ
jgi:hypothetical protein